MRCKLILIPFAFVLITIYACTSQPEETEKILASINEFDLKVSEFQRLLAADMEIDPDFKLTEEAKKNYLSEMIQKEILIQEAKRLDLDRKLDFIRTIERYWEATLIRNLMRIKGEEIDKRIIVSQEEVEQRYATLKRESDDVQSLGEIQEELHAEMIEHKKTIMFQDWMDKLKQKADVSINKELLNNL